MLFKEDITVLRFLCAFMCFFSVVQAAECSLEEFASFGKELSNSKFPEGLPRVIDSDISAFLGKIELSKEDLSVEFVEFVKAYGHMVFPARTLLMLQSMFHEFTVPLVLTAWEEGVPTTHLPFCNDNSDYYCIDLKAGGVYLWSHDLEKFTEDMWVSFNSWVLEDWLPLMKLGV